MSSRMCSGSPSGIRPPVWRYRETVQPSYPGVCNCRKIARAALDERLDLEVFFPDRAVAQVLREASAEQVGGLEEVPVGRDDEILLRHASRALDQPVGTGNKVRAGGGRKEQR